MQTKQNTETRPAPTSKAAADRDRFLAHARKVGAISAVNAPGTVDWAAVVLAGRPKES